MWFMILPIYTLRKAWRLYLIEASGMVAKVLLLAIAKVLSKIDETQAVFLCLLVLSIQLIIFVVLCKYQTLSQAEKLKKLNQLNSVDLVLYLTLEVSCIIGIIDYLVSPEADSVGKNALMGALILINSAFIVVWIFTTFCLSHLIYTSSRCW